MAWQERDLARHDAEPGAPGPTHRPTLRGRARRPEAPQDVAPRSAQVELDGLARLRIEDERREMRIAVERRPEGERVGGAALTTLHGGCFSFRNSHDELQYHPCAQRMRLCDHVA